MKYLTKKTNEGHIQIASETYLELVQTVANNSILLDDEMKDDLISYAYDESNTIGADETIRFSIIGEGVYIAPLFINEIILMQLTQKGEYKVEIVKEDDARYPGFKTELS